MFTAVGTAVSVFLLSVETLRYRKGWKWMNRIYMFFFRGILRKTEMTGKMSGTFYYFAGCTATAHLFPGLPAVLGIAQLAIADPTASYFGRQTKHLEWSRIADGAGGLGKNKGILGFVAGALLCVPFNFLLLKSATWAGGDLVPPTIDIALASTLIAIAGSLSDLLVPTPTLSLPDKLMGIKLPPLHIDDNFVVPICSAAVAKWSLRWLSFPAVVQISKFLVWGGSNR
jgi:dolichol kinase